MRRGHPISDAAKKAIGDANRGRVQSAATCLKKSETAKLLWQDPVYRQACLCKGLSGADNPNFGKHPSDETRAKMRASHLGKHPSAAAIEKTAAARRGSVHSDESKTLISLMTMMSQPPHTEEWKHQHSADMRGHPNWNTGGYKCPESHSVAHQVPCTDARKSILSQQRKEQWQDPEFAKMMRDALTSPERRQACSDSHKKLWQDPEYREEKLRTFVLPGIAASRGATDTDIECMTAAVFDRLGIQYQKQALLPGWGGPVDFYLPQSKTAVECDGAYWHSLPESQERDERKSLALMHSGFGVLRLHESFIQQYLTA